MNQCKCGSYAINPRHHGREPGVDLHLCDVCYWRSRADRYREALEVVSQCEIIPPMMTEQARQIMRLQGIAKKALEARP